MRKTELLAPAKDKETAIEAINCGADAVYIGAGAFGARKNAANSLEDIKSVIKYAHKFRVKIFITVNTILTDEELEEAFELVKKLDEMNADAVIIQDMGLLKKIIESDLKIPVHISTQADNRDIEKIIFFNKIGVSRVVLARELSLEQIKEIHKANPDLELEAFVHGALCVSYSGQCYLSQYIGGRSANRGECAQPCRKKYTVMTGDGKILAENIYALCLKDFNASKCLKDMIDAGIYSFKIEGRLKDKNYVKNITAYYRKELDKFSQKTSSGKCFYPFAPNPEKSFNREFTEYFLKGRTECFNFISPKSKGEYLGKVTEIKKDRFKIDTDKEISPQDGLTFGNEGFLVNKISDGYIYPNKKLNLKTGTKIFRNNNVKFEKELSLPVKRQIGVEVRAGVGVGVNRGVNRGVNVGGNRGVNDSRILCGETAMNIVLTDEDGVCVTYTIPDGEKPNNPKKMKETFIKQFSKTGESDFYINNIKVEGEIPFMPVSEINRIRRICFEKLTERRIKEYKRQNQKQMQIQSFYKKSVDYRANIHNKEAKAFYELCGTDVLQMSFESLPPKSDIELMRTKHCIKYALGICKEPVKLLLKDEHGKIYHLEFDCKNCEMVLKP